VIFILDHLLAKMLVYEQLLARNIMEIHLHSRSFNHALLMFYEISKTLNGHNISVKVLVSWTVVSFKTFAVHFRSVW